MCCWGFLRFGGGQLLGPSRNNGRCGAAQLALLREFRIKIERENPTVLLKCTTLFGRCLAAP